MATNAQQKISTVHNFIKTIPNENTRIILSYYAECDERELLNVLNCCNKHRNDALAKNIQSLMNIKFS